MTTQINSTVADIQLELHDIERRLHSASVHGSKDTLALLACIFVIVASSAGLPLGILGVIAIARQMVNRRKLLQRAAALDRTLATKHDSSSDG